MTILSNKTIAVKIKTPGEAGAITASITEIKKGTHASGDLPIVVNFDIRQVPAGTIAMSLSFITNQEWDQSANPWEGPKTYEFPANIWSGHEKVIGKPAGVAVEITFVLRAIDEDGGVLNESRGSFKLNKVKW